MSSDDGIRGSDEVFVAGEYEIRHLDDGTVFITREGEGMQIATDKLLDALDTLFMDNF